MTPKGSSKRSSADRVCGFPPIAAPDARVLILGTAPSVRSLQKAQYYGHPQNAFWWIMSRVLGEPSHEDYQERGAMLLRHRVALWDVIADCSRVGSSDAAIRDVTPRSFASFFRRHRLIRAVFFNGRTAYDLYRKHAGLREGMEHILLPGTSPLYTVSKEEKLKGWRILKRYLL